MMNLVNVPAGWFQTGSSFRRSGVGQGIFVVDLTGFEPVTSRGERV
jgi:hypothetical protein